MAGNSASAGVWASASTPSAEAPTATTLSVSVSTGIRLATVAGIPTKLQWKNRYRVTGPEYVYAVPVGRVKAVR